MPLIFHLIHWSNLYFVGFIDNVNICEILSIFEIFFKNLSKFKSFLKNLSIFKLVQFYSTIKLRTWILWKFSKNLSILWFNFITLFLSFSEN